MFVVLIWFIVVLVFVGVEVLIGDMFLLMFGGGVLVVLVSSWLLVWLMWVDGVVFFFVLVLLLVLVWLVVWCWLMQIKGVQLGIEVLEGKKVVVFGWVVCDGGQVKLDGQVWMVCLFNDGDVFEFGDLVIVV